MPWPRFPTHCRSQSQNRKTRLRSNFQSCPTGPRRLRRLLRRLPPHLARRRLRPHDRSRRLQRPLRSLSSRKQPVLGRGRRARNLHVLPRSAQAALARCGLLRPKLPGVPRLEHRREEISKSSRRCLSGVHKKLCKLPHAQSRAPQSAFHLHRSLDPHSQTGFRLSRVTTCATTSTSAAIFSGSWQARPQPPAACHSLLRPFLPWQKNPAPIFLSQKFSPRLPASTSSTRAADPPKNISPNPPAPAAPSSTTTTTAGWTSTSSTAAPAISGLRPRPSATRSTITIATAPSPTSPKELAPPAAATAWASPQATTTPTASPISTSPHTA